jgi:acyl-homoserine-lactone acylase
LWTEFKKVQELPQYINPVSGYLYNTNHSPFLATNPDYNLDIKKFDPNDGFETYHNNRSQRVADLTKDITSFDYSTFKKIKFDYHLPQQLRYPYGIDSMLDLRAEDYPQLKDIITTFQQWDRNSIASSKGAAIFLLIYNYVAGNVRGQFPARWPGQAPRELTRQESIDAYQYVYDHMMKYFNRTDLVLGDIQKLVRGEDARPASGMPDVLASAYTQPYKNGTRKIVSGDAYICFVRYPKNGLPVIESVNTFGASMHPDSPHYKDQMTMFQEQKTKRMTLDKEEVLRKAERIYHPLKQ